MTHGGFDVFSGFIEISIFTGMLDFSFGKRDKET